MEKRFNKGLVLGKFMPAHNGHLHLINTAAVCCDKLIVMCCSLKSDPINGLFRYGWLKMIFEDNQNVEIIHVQDENPQKPEECDTTDTFYNDFWVPTVKNRVNDLEVIFTSESYGDEFAKYLGIEHVLVDIDRKVHPISGTMVRDNPFKHWDYIPDIVKPYFTKRIVVMGPESTGKSTLVQMLAEHYGTQYQEEYGRTYVNEVKPAKSLDKEDFINIALKHNDMMLEKHAFCTDKHLFIDTEAITTKLFGQLYLKDYEDTRIDEIIKYQWFDLILLMDIDIPWVDDNTRDFPNHRATHFTMIEIELHKLGRKCVIISGDFKERFEKAKKEVDKLGYL